MIRARRLLPVMVSLILAAFSPVVHAAHSRRARVTVRNTASPRYDRSITTFDQTGRLLQVEYGMEAANRGEAVVAVWTEAKIYVFVRNSSSQKVHRLDENIFLFSAGLSGDARALASSLRSSSQQHRLSYGEAPTVEQAARHAASLQHQLTRKFLPRVCLYVLHVIRTLTQPALTLPCHGWWHRTFVYASVSLSPVFYFLKKKAQEGLVHWDARQL